MSNKAFVIILAVLLVGMIGIFVKSKNNSEPPKTRLGYEQPDEGRQHLGEGQGQYSQTPPTKSVA